MERRDLLKMIAAVTGTAFVGSHVLAYDQVPSVELKDTDFSKDDVAFINEVGEVIMPKTDTPGAKAANVGLTIAIIVSDCYTAAEEKVFKQGLTVIKDAAKSKFQKDFSLLNQQQQTEILTKLDVEAKEYNRIYGPQLEEKSVLPHYFSMLKQLVLFALFTSEVGATKVLRYVPIPGYYDGDLDYKKGDKAWAK